MRETNVSIPELALIAGTRTLLGVGVGLLLAKRLGHDRRIAVGWTLVVIGALTTIPSALEVFGGGRLSRKEGRAVPDVARRPEDREIMTH